MKNLKLLTLSILLSATVYAQTYTPFSYSPKFLGSGIFTGTLSVGQNSGPNPSAAFEVFSNNKGFLMPRLSTLQRNSIRYPSIGLMIYNTTTSAFNFYNGSAWTTISGASSVTGTPTEIPYFSPTGNIISDNAFIRDSATKATSIYQDGGGLLPSYEFTMDNTNDGLQLSTVGVSGTVSSKINIQDSSIVFAGQLSMMDFYRYSFPNDTGSVGQVLGVADNDGAGTTTLGWQTPTITGMPTQIPYFNSVGNLTSDGTFYRDSTNGVTIITSAKGDTTAGLLIFPFYGAVQILAEDTVAAKTSSIAAIIGSISMVNESPDADTRIDMGDYSMALSATSTFANQDRNRIIIDTTQITFVSGEEFGFQNSYSFPTDTGSVGQVLAVDSNDALGYTRLSWQTLSDVLSGTYIPTKIDSSNILNMTMGEAFFTKIDSIVTVTGLATVSVDVATETSFKINLPFEALFTVLGVNRGSGTAYAGGVTYPDYPVYVTSENATQARIFFDVPILGAQPIRDVSFSFTYKTIE